MSNVAYPTNLNVHISSQRTRRDGRVEDTVGDGHVRVRKLHADRFDFTVVHAGLNANEVAQIENFYTSYSTALLDFVWPEDNVTYVVRFGKDAITKAFASKQLRNIAVRLVAAS